MLIEPVATDLLIVGAGPTGLFGAFYAGLRHMSVRLLDSLEALGGQLATLYPEKYIYDVAGFPKVLAKDLVTQLVEQAMTASPAINLGERVGAIETDPDAPPPYGFRVLSDRAIYRARAVIVTAGVGSFSPRRLPIEDSQRFEGRGLHYFVTRPEQFRDQRVLIVGGGDSAVDWANHLASIARQVTLIHRRDQFRAHEAAVTELTRHGRVRIEYFHELRSLQGEERIRQAIIYDNRSNHEQTLEVDAVLVNVGFENAIGPIKEWGLAMAGTQIAVDAQMRSSRPGVFAAGDIVAHPGKLKLIATGFAEAAIAVNFAKHDIDPKAAAFPGHSSSMKR